MSTIVVTGAASGIGAATVERLARAGHTIVTVDLHDADVEVNLGVPAERARAADAVAARCDGRLDGLVTCAGIGGLPDRAGSLVVTWEHPGRGEDEQLMADELPEAPDVGGHGHGSGGRRRHRLG